MDRFAEFQGSSFLSWMFTIAHHLVIDGQRRKAASRDESLDSVPPEAVVSVEPEPWQGLFDQETRQHLRGCLQGLTDDQRQLVLARYREGLGGDALMARLGITARGTLDSRHARAVDLLTTCMESAETKSKNIRLENKVPENHRRGAKT